MAFLPLLAFGGLCIGRVDQLLPLLFIHIFIARSAALLVLVLEPGAALAQDAKIMVRELKIIFGLDAVAGELGIARHAFVFLEQLDGIAALTIVLPVSGLAAEVLAPLSPAAAPAAALTIVDQMPTSLRSSG